jgi:hypothetical protein
LQWPRNGEKRCGCVKIRRRRTENSSVAHHHRRGDAEPVRVGVARPNSERSSVPNSGGQRSSTTLEPDRLRVILERLKGQFYDEAPASDRIAAGVLADVKDFDESSVAFPH